MAGEDTAGAEESGGSRRRWLPFVLVAVGSLGLGMVVGWSSRAPESAPVYLELTEQHESIGQELDEAQDLESDYQETITGLREQVTQLERPFDELDEREDGLDDREGELDDREDGLGTREGDLDEREGGLDQREEGLDERAEELDGREDEVTGLETEAEENSFPGSGTFVVNDEVSPGTYRSSGAESCYWARLSSTDGSFDAIITNHFGGGPQVVTIAESDAAFETRNCGEWTRS